MNVEDLTGEAAEVYESWRTIGLDETAALQAVVDAGLAVLDPYDEDVEFYMRFANLDESTARLAAQGRGHMTEAGARAARRRAPGSSDSPGSAGDSALVERVDTLIDEGLSAAVALSRVNVEEMKAGRPVPVWLSEAAHEAAREVFSGDRGRAAAFGESWAPALLEEKRGRPRSKRKPAHTPGPAVPSTVTTTEGSRKPSRQRTELVESKDLLADRVRFFTDVMGLDEAAAKVAAAGRDPIEGT